MITHDLRLIADAAYDKKGLDVVSLDLRKIDGAITDFFVVCDGSNTTQVGAIAENIAEKMKRGIRCTAPREKATISGLSRITAISLSTSS